MVERRSLILDGGRVKELPIGDTLAGSAGGGGTAEEVTTITTNFTNHLSAADTTVQLALDTLDDIPVGDVVGAASSTDEGIVRFDGTTGKLIQDSSVEIDDSGVLTSLTDIKCGNTSFFVCGSGKLDRGGFESGHSTGVTMEATHNTGKIMLVTNGGSFNMNELGNLGVDTELQTKKFEVSGTAGYTLTTDMGVEDTDFASKLYADNVGHIATTAVQEDIASSSNFVISDSVDILNVIGNEEYAPAPVLLIQSDTTDGSATFVDSSASAHTVTGSGQVHHETDWQKFGATSIQFDGVSDNLTIPNHVDFDFGTGDFIIDFWARFTDLSNNIEFINNGSTTGGFRLFRFSAGNTNFYVNSTGLTITNYVFAINTNYHIALVRSSGDFILFINGNEEGRITTQGAAVVTPTEDFVIGGATQGMNGYIDEFRVVKGSDGGWEPGFVPPIAPYSPTVPPTAWIELIEDVDYSVATGDTVTRLRAGTADMQARYQKALTNLDTLIQSNTILSLDGDVGIGTLAPSHLLHVNGVARSTQSAWATSSDSRVKENIQYLDTLPSSLDKIMALAPCTFDYKPEYCCQPSGNGFLAQEYKLIFPESVTECEEIINTKTGETVNDFNILDVSVLLPVLVRAMQEQQIMIADLTTRIETLEANHL